MGQFRLTRHLQLAAAASVCGALTLTLSRPALACTAFCASGAGQVLVGNNEDYINPRTKIWFVPSARGSYGRVYVGFDDLWPQGGMNERGLWFDGFSAPPVRVPTELPTFQGNLIDTVMAECETVEEVVRVFGRYNRGFLREAILMFADASGDAVSIEGDAIVRKSHRYFVQTNFHQSRPPTGGRDGRFATASLMLEQAGEHISVDLFRRILAATHQRGGAPTLYSNVYDLRARTMHLYYFHDFERAVTFDLDDELKKGARVLDIPSLFPPNAAAEAFTARRRTQRREVDWMPFAGAAAGVLVLAGLAGVLAVRGWTHGGRPVRWSLGALGATLALVVVACALVLRVDRRRSIDWIEFSIGPESGTSASIGPTAIRSSGITLKTVLATAYEIPSVRVIGPPWLARARYSITAAVPPESSDSFRALLREELSSRLHLDVHVEPRVFDVLVLTATDAPRLERALGSNVRVWIQDADAQLQDVSMERVASALQGILGTPVVDETGITGSYNLEFAWSGDRVESVTRVLHDQFGLRLSPGRRELDALIVDSSRRDASLLLLGHVGQLTRQAPQPVRDALARLLAVR